MTKRYSLCESPSFAQTSSTFLTVDTSSPDDPRPLAPSPTSFRHSTGSPLPLSPLKPRSDSLGVPTHPAPLPLRSVPQLHPRPLIPETPLSAPIPAPAPASTPAPAPTQTQTLTPHRSRSHDALHPRSSSTPSQPPPQPRPLLIFHPGRPTPRIPRLRIRGQDPPPSQPSQPPNANSLPPTAPPPPPPTPPTPPTPPSAVAPAGTKPQAAEAEIGIARQVSVRGQASGVVLLAGKRSVERMVERKAGQAGQARLIELGTPGSLARYYKGRGAGVGTGTETGTGTAEGLRVGVAGIEA